MTSLAQPLIGWLAGLGNLTSRRRRSLPRLLSMRLADHDLADLNLPARMRTKLEIERLRETARLGIYR